jgi:hypothetical protein
MLFFILLLDSEAMSPVGWSPVEGTCSRSFGLLFKDFRNDFLKDSLDFSVCFTIFDKLLGSDVDKLLVFLS